MPIDRGKKPASGNAPGNVLLVEVGLGPQERIRDLLPEEWSIRLASPDEIDTLDSSVSADLVVLDLGTPQVDTWAMVTRLARAEATAGLPLLLASIRPTAGWVLGLAGALAKPVNPRTLWLAVERLQLPHRAKVLVVDDDPNSNETVARRLEYESYQVLRAPDGEEALDIAREARPDALIINPLVADGQGFALVAGIRAIGAEPLTRFLLLLPETLRPEDSQWLIDQVEAESRGPLDAQQVAREIKRATVVGYDSATHLKAEPDAPLVLIVEDDPLYQRLLSVYLTDVGCRVSVAENGYEALALLGEERPALITLDLSLPDLDGFSVLEVLRKQPNGKDIPVVILSGMADSGAVLGAAAFLSKPVGRDQLLSVMRNLGVG